MSVFLAIRVVFDDMDYSFTGNIFALREEPSLSWGSFGREIVVFESVAASLENIALFTPAEDSYRLE
jgi:hypothetical protein